MQALLDPTNDYVFKRLFAAAPELLVALINDLRAWITFFKHWREELTMANIAHEPVQQAMNRIRTLSADEEARRLAFVRERALHDEVSFLNQARREGLAEGREEGREEGRKEERAEVARNLLAMNLLTDEQIAAAAGLTEAEVSALRER